VTLPANHPQRVELNDEVHARPPEALTAPVRLTYLALISDWSRRESEAAHVAALAAQFGVPGPAPGATHFSADLGPFRLKWERHTEFARYTFAVPGREPAPFTQPAIDLVPEAWRTTLPGNVIVAAHAVLLPDEGPADYEAISAAHFGGHSLVGAAIGAGAATALTDFRVREGRYSRLLVLDRAMTPWQAGRMLQRLLELETYRIMALLALPVARELSPFLTRCGVELAQITSAMADVHADSEGPLLDRLTRLEAQIEERASVNHYRFGAATAYYDLVRARIAELREERIQGLQTFQEFTERRLAPAMNTCRAVAGRQESMSQRVARATQLLSTRVGITHERQNQALLESMNRRARLQLRLQETVEGLSIAAITYYVAGLVAACAKGLKALGVAVDPDLAAGASVPIIALIAALGIRKIRRMVAAGGARA